MTHCWLRLRRHRFGESYVQGPRTSRHRYKDCADCGRHKLVAHVRCGEWCWGGYQ